MTDVFHQWLGGEKKVGAVAQATISKQILHRKSSPSVVCYFPLYEIYPWCFAQTALCLCISLSRILCCATGWLRPSSGSWQTGIPSGSASHWRCDSWWTVPPRYAFPFSCAAEGTMYSSRYHCTEKEAQSTGVARFRGSTCTAYAVPDLSSPSWLLEWRVSCVDDHTGRALNC